YVLGLETGAGAIGFGLLVALCLAASYAAMGAAWLIYKTEGDLQLKAVRLLRQALMFTAAGMVAVSLATPFASARLYEKWFSWPQIALLAPLPILTGIVFLLLWRLSFRMPAPGDQHALTPFLALAAIFAFGFAGLAYSFYPYVVPDRLTIWEAAAAPGSLAIILARTAITL